MAITTRDRRLVVRAHRPGRLMLVVVVATLAAGILAWMAFEYGQWQLIYARMTASSRAPRPEPPAVDTVEQLKAENGELKQRVAILERAAQVDREADVRLKEHLHSVQNKTYELKEEVEFYRNIVSSSRSETGLRIQAMRITALGESGRYHYKLVLTNLGKDDKVTTGSVSIEVAGKRQSVAQKFQVTTPEGGLRTTALPFSFVHFHRLEGDITLPEGFDPESVRIVIREESVKEPLEDASYDWTSLVSARG